SFVFSGRRRHTIFSRDWSSDVCSSDLRMLKDPKARSLVTNFAFQWLDVRGVAQIDPDPVVFPEFDYNLGKSFEKELELFVASILLEDRSVLELLRADHTFVNERLALHYGIGDVQGDQFRRVTLIDPNRRSEERRGGEAASPR